jgi:hypothetical protein
MATMCLLESLETTFTPEVIEEFGGLNELLMCLESLRTKLHSGHDDALSAEANAE